MAPKTLKNKVSPINWAVPIANKDGTATAEFQRAWGRQARTNATIVDLTTAAGVSAVLDLIGASSGAILERGTLAWGAVASPSDATKFLNGAALPAYAKVKDTDLAMTAASAVNDVSITTHGFAPILPNDATKFLNGAGAYTVPAGGSGAASSAMDDGTNFYLAMQDGAGQLILDTFGDPIFALEVLPPAALPVGTSAAFGALKVDNSTIQAVAGIVSTLFNGLYLTLTAVQAYTAAGAYQKALYDVITLDSQGAYSAITGKFTPTKAGKYLVFCVGQAQAFTSVTQANMIASKNGTIGGTGTGVFTIVVGGGASAGDSAPMAGLGLVAMNGTTDFLELDFFIAGTGGSLALKQASTWGALYVGA